MREGEGGSRHLLKADFNRESSRDNEFTIQHGSLATRFKAVRRTKRCGN